MKPTVRIPCSPLFRAAVLAGTTPASLKTISKQDSSYEKKRDFRKSPEPRGGRSRRGHRRRFVIQKHDASRLHYDFRLEIGERLVSWALPKGPSTAANERRLAVRTEDHPTDYADFEGVIPEGEYGAGTVMVWDRGTFVLAEDPKAPDGTLDEAIANGSLKVILDGEKLTGGYALARMGRGDDDERQEKWMFFKTDDQAADARRNPTSTQPDSVLSDRSLEEIGNEDRNDSS